MITIANEEWIADIHAKTCTNYEKKIIVKFEKSGKTYIGKIDNMPIELVSKWAKKSKGEKYLIHEVEEAEKVFLRALAETSFENQMRMNSGDL